MQVTLREPQAHVVQRLENPVHVVAALRDHRHQGQARDDRGFDALDVCRVIRVIVCRQLGPEEPVCGSYRVRAARLRCRIQAGQIRGAVGLSRE